MADRGKVRNEMREQRPFHRPDRASAGGGRDRPEGGGGGGNGSSMMLPLPPGWLCLQDCNLSGQFGQPVVVPFVLMHPDVGVALIDLAPAANPDAESVLRRRLEAARFESIFSGFLPILHLRLDRADLPSTETILRDAFAALPRLSVPGGDGWVNVVRRALLPRDLGRAAPHSAGPPGAAAGRAPRRPACPALRRRRAPRCRALRRRWAPRRPAPRRRRGLRPARPAPPGAGAGSGDGSGDAPT